MAGPGYGDYLTSRDVIAPEGMARFAANSFGATTRESLPGRMTNVSDLRPDEPCLVSAVAAVRSRWLRASLVPEEPTWLAAFWTARPSSRSHVLRPDGHTPRQRTCRPKPLRGRFQTQSCLAIAHAGTPESSRPDLEACCSGNRTQQPVRWSLHSIAIFISSVAQS